MSLVVTMTGLKNGNPQKIHYIPEDKLWYRININHGVLEIYKCNEHTEVLSAAYAEGAWERVGYFPDE